MKSVGSSSLIALLFAATFAAPAAAAAAPMAPTYMSSEPSDGEMMDEAPDRVEVTFDEPLDEGSSLSVTDECGRKVDDGKVEVQANTMSVGLALKPIGEYTVGYFAKSLGGVTGQESGTFDFMVHSGPSCGKTQDGDHGNNHGGGNHNNGGGDHGGNHQGNNNGGGAYNGHNGHSGGGGGDANHGSTDHGSGSGTTHSSTNHSGSGARSNHSSGRHGSGHQSSGKHDSNKHVSGRHGSGKHGSGEHGAAGAHGLLDILDQNERDEERALAAGADGLTAPDGQAVALALALSLLMGVVGGWFLRVSGAR